MCMYSIGNVIIEVISSTVRVEINILQKLVAFLYVRTV